MTEKLSKIVPRDMRARNMSIAKNAAGIVQLPVEQAAAILARCVKVDEVREVRNVAEAKAFYARRKKGAEDAERDAEAIAEHADRRLGELAAGERVLKGGRPAKTASPVTQFPKAEKRTSQREVARSKAKAAIPAKRFSTTIGEALEAKRSPKKAVAKLIAKPKKPKPIEAKPVPDPLHAMRFPSIEPAPSVLYAQTLPSDGWDAAKATAETLAEMRTFLATAREDEVVPLRVALARWQGMVRG